MTPIGLQVVNGARDNGSLGATISVPCSLRASAASPKITVLPGSGDWPLDGPTRSKTMNQIKQLAKDDDPNVDVPFVWGYTRQATGYDSFIPKKQYRQCYGVSEVRFTFMPIEMFIAKEVEPGRCHDRVSQQHERRHYDSLTAASRERQEAARNTVRGFYIPTAAQPIYVRSAAERDEALKIISDKIDAVMAPVLAESEARSRQAQRDLDAQDTQPTLAKCQNWPQPR
jgi:hypothetical protein